MSMLYLKLYEDFVLEKLNQVTKFYHKTGKEHLESLLNGIDPKKTEVFSSNDSKSQGGGFYVYTDLEVCKKWSGNLKNAIIIEIEAVLNLTNFEIDYELGFREVDNKQMKPAEYYKILFNTTKDMCSKNNLNFYRIDFIQGDEEKQKINNLVKVTEPNWGNIFVLSEDELTKDDINLNWYLEDVDYYIVSSQKNIGWFHIVPPGGGLKKAEYESMKSLDKFGIKKEFESKVFDSCIAFKYRGPVVRPTKYMIEENGNWSEWINNN